MSVDYIKVRFRLLYRPRYQGEQPAVIGSIPELGNWRIDPSCNLHQRARCLPVVVSGLDRGLETPKVWETVIKLPAQTECDWSWTIITPKKNKKTRESINRRLVVGEQCLIVHSEWGVLDEVVIPNTCKVDIQAKYVTPPGKVLAISGSTGRLGNWDPLKCVVMDSCFPKRSGKWRASLTVNNEIETDWKLVVIDKETREVCRWEERRNRCLMVCGQWVKIEATWGQGELMIDTMSLDFDDNFNTKKILEAKRRTKVVDADIAASSGVPVCPPFEGFRGLHTPESEMTASHGPNHLSAEAIYGGCSIPTPETELGQAAASDLKVEPSKNSALCSGEMVQPGPREQVYLNDKMARASPNVYSCASTYNGDGMLHKKTPDVQPNEVNASEILTTKRRFLRSPQRQTSMRNQTPCQVVVNTKTEVISCTIVNDITDSSGITSAQGGDHNGPEKYSSQVPFCNGEPLKSSVENVDDVQNHGNSEGQQRSTFFSFEKRNQALQFLGHHRNFTFFPAFLIFLKVVNDYYLNTK